MAVNCTTVVPVDTVTATDSCGASVPVTYSNQLIPGSCSGCYTEVRTWTAVDQCGLSTSTSQLPALGTIRAVNQRSGTIRATPPTLLICALPTSL
jgi:hypothetical protein